jgi:hypothetical protein
MLTLEHEAGQLFRCQVMVHLGPPSNMLEGRDPHHCIAIRFMHPPVPIVKSALVPWLNIARPW